MTSLKTMGRVAGVLAMALCGSAVAADPPAPGATSLAAAYATLASKKFVDLTHAFGPATPHWKGFGEETVTVMYTIPKDGFKVQQFTHVGQWGTQDRKSTRLNSSH